MPKVSVIVPLYNPGPYLAECLDAVLAQSLREIEVVCVDDGSTDPSPVVLAAYAARDARVKVIRQENAGSGPARNAGLAAATGEFVAFMDADDLYADDRVLEDLYGGAIANGVDVCGGGLRMLDGRDLGEGFTFAADGTRNFADYQFGYGYTRYVFRRDMLVAGDIRFPSLCRFQDVPFCIEALHAAGRFFALKRTVYLYRDGHRTVEWSADGARKAVDNVRGLVQSRDLALRFGYDRMVRFFEVRLDDFIRLLGSEANGLRSHRDVLIREVENQKNILNDLRSSVSFRTGRLLTAPLRCCRNLIKGKSS